METVTKVFTLLLFLQYSLAELDTSWWKNAIIYEVYVASFKDSNGDGIGDIKGVTMMLDHFVDLKIDCIYLSSFCKSPMLDQGYDITNFIDINPQFGTIKDFEELVRECNKRGLKVIMDFVINHSSDQHEWFQKSIDRIHPYSDFYIWKDAKSFNNDSSPNPPNNWRTVFAERAWQWNDKRGQFYLHQFSKYQPDFNLRNKILKKEIYKILKFWLDKGIAGARIDAAGFFMEDALFRDEPLLNNNLTDSDDYADYDHKYTKGLWDSYEYLHQLRKYVDKFSRGKKDFERILMSEDYTDLNHTMQYYGTKEYPIVQFPFNFDLVIYLAKFEKAAHFHEVMHHWLDNMPKEATANWNVENHDRLRVGSRLSPHYMDILLITIMMAPGVAYIYYGQEIGMVNHVVREDQRQDPYTDLYDPLKNPRDGERLPMQWDDSINAGFSGKRIPWLPVDPNYAIENVKSQKARVNSRYNLFKTLSELRKTKTLKHGDFQSFVLSTWVFAFVRTLENNESYVVIHNLGSETEIIDLHINIKGLPSLLKVVTSSINSGYEKGTIIRSESKFPETFSMRPLSSIVLTTVPEGNI